MQLSGCKNLEYVKLILQYNAYDTDATVEALVAEYNASGGFSFEEEEKERVESKKESNPVDLEEKVADKANQGTSSQAKPKSGKTKAPVMKKNTSAAEEANSLKQKDL
jgi:hypothetical protein